MATWVELVTPVLTFLGGALATILGFIRANKRAKEQTAKLKLEIEELKRQKVVVKNLEKELLALKEEATKRQEFPAPPGLLVGRDYLSQHCKNVHDRIETELNSFREKLDADVSKLRDTGRWDNRLNAEITRLYDKMDSLRSDLVKQLTDLSSEMSAALENISGMGRTVDKLGENTLTLMGHSQEGRHRMEVSEKRLDTLDDRVRSLETGKIRRG